MRAVGLVLLMGLAASAPLSAGPALAQQTAPAVSAADRAAIIAVIRDQMAAFQRDDAAGAFRFASPGIRGMFGQDPNQFLDMVRHGYQPVYRPRTTAFGITETAGGEIIQHVEVEGPDGITRTALYTMERQPDGSWRISGCFLTDSGAVGA
jgi:ketosteroid isomerase-like protein